MKRFGDVPWISKPLDMADPTLYNGRDPRTLVMHSVLADLNFACQNITTPAGNSRSLVTRQAPVFSYTYTGYQPIKWTLDDTYYDGGSRNTNSISIIRYAEVLLNYAEAKAELGTLSDADWAKTVGALRQRAGIQRHLRRAYVAEQRCPEVGG